MKVVLSRKGMDSASGGIPSPILPDNTLLSLPIPDGESGLSYDKVAYQGHTYKEIIQQLRPSFKFEKHPFCHLDPDLYDVMVDRPEGWIPAFGQCGISARHLDKMKIGEGDVFLFYGMFRRTESHTGTLAYKKDAAIQHIIYAYLHVGEVLDTPEKIKNRCPWHPHAINVNRPNNRLYIPSDYGVFSYDEKYLLTKPNQSSRRLWSLPAFFAEDGIDISWQGKNKAALIDGYAELNSACRGQEFVVTAKTAELEQNLCRWVEHLTGRDLK